MSVNIKIEKKHLYLLSAILIFLVGVGVVIAYNIGPPNVHGHALAELDLTGFSGGTGGVSLFTETEEVVLYTSTTCADGTNNVWKTIDVSPYVPTAAIKAILKTYCGENVMSLRAFGSSLAQEITDTVACKAGNDASEALFYFVSLNSDKKFETYNRGTDCNTRLVKITLVGYG